MFLLLHITCSCIFMHTYLTFSIFLYIDCDWYFSACLSLSLLLSISYPMHLNENLLHLKTLFVPEHLLLIPLPLMFDSVMIKPCPPSVFKVSHFTPSFEEEEKYYIYIYIYIYKYIFNFIVLLLLSPTISL